MLLIGTKSDAQPFESEYPGIRKIIPEEYDYFPCRKTFLTIETLFRGHDFFFAGGKHLRKVFFLILSPWIRSFLGDRESRSGDVSFRPPQLAETYLFRQHLVLPCGAGVARCCVRGSSASGDVEKVYRNGPSRQESFEHITTD